MHCKRIVSYSHKEMYLFYVVGGKSDPFADPFGDGGRNMRPKTPADDVSFLQVQCSVI